MAVYCVTGKLGAGKTLAAVDRIRQHLNANKRVATNLDLYLEKLINPFSKNANVLRLPDVPSAEDMKAIGLGYEGDFRGDDHNGLIVLDECAKWLNSRDYRDKNRKGLIDWMIHARKKRWDIIFIIQDIEAMDKQFRDLFCEFGVFCRRMDRYSIPFLSFFTKLFTGKPARPMRLHVGLVKYGFTESAPVVDRWWYRGTDIFDAYDTEQSFNELDSCGLHSMLPPNTIYGRYITKLEVFKNATLALGTLPFLIGGVLLGSLAVKALEPDPYAPNSGLFSCNDAYENLIGCDIKPTELTKILSNHRGGKVAEGVVSDSSDTATEDTPQDDSLNIYITGSVAYDSGQYDYFFEIDGQPVQPWSLGYRVYDITDCSAMLVDVNNSDNRFKATCKHGEKSL
jgi:hypothetical protein